MPPAISSSSGGTKKPFTYCPGGINFDELKSPRMARRIARNRSQAEDSQASPVKPSQEVNNSIVS